MVDFYRASVSKVKSEWLSLFFQHRPLWLLSSLSEHTADFLAMAWCCILTQETTLPGWHCTNTDLELSVKNDLEECGWFEFGHAASILLSHFSCSSPSPDPQIQRLNVSNPALHWQQGCKNESRRRVALLWRDWRRARVASP